MNAYHWTPESRSRFIDVLARTGNVRHAAASVGMTRESAYRLRRRKAEADFAHAWDAAILVAQAYVGDIILDHAMSPIKYRAVVSATTGRTGWRRAEPLLGAGHGLGLVTRLDRSAACVERNAVRHGAAQALVPALFERLSAGVT